jgi:hypothetical protein
MRRFLRFSIRDLLWLTLVVAVGVGWWIRDSDLRSQLRILRRPRPHTEWQVMVGAFEDAVRKAGWKPRIDYDNAAVELIDDSSWGFGRPRIVAPFAQPEILREE